MLRVPKMEEDAIHIVAREYCRPNFAIPAKAEIHSLTGKIDCFPAFERASK